MGDTFCVLHLEGVSGESKRFDEHLDVIGGTVSATNDNSTLRAGGQGQGAGMIHDIPVVVNHCRASTELLNRVASGTKTFPKGSLKVYTGDAENPFLVKTYEMEQVVISSYHEQLGAKDLHITLSPVVLKWTYTEQNDDGTEGSKFDGGFNRKTLKPA
jgi:type VI protein secretion system component Hcp